MLLLPAADELRRDCAATTNANAAMLPLPPLPPPLRCNCCRQLSAAAELRRDCAAATTTNAAVLPLPLKSLLRCNRCAATYACAAAAAAAAATDAAALSCAATALPLPPPPLTPLCCRCLR
jgi:hypothetical protein